MFNLCLYALMLVNSVQADSLAKFRKQYEEYRTQYLVQAQYAEGVEDATSPITLLTNSQRLKPLAELMSRLATLYRDEVTTNNAAVRNGTATDEVSKQYLLLQCAGNDLSAAAGAYSDFLCDGDSFYLNRARKIADIWRVTDDRLRKRQARIHSN